jgi:RNA-directed DNA polymerase
MREPVSEAQARIRETVARKRQGKQTALPHHINIDIPRTSFFWSEDDGSAGSWFLF